MGVKKIWCQMGVKIFYISNGCKDILGVKLA